MTGHPAVDWIVTAAAVITALLVIWTKAIRPLLKATQELAEAVPVLLAMAKEFEANHGTSLRDVVDRIDQTAAEARDQAAAANEKVDRLLADEEG